jgi:hypothetical protein
MINTLQRFEENAICQWLARGVNADLLSQAGRSPRKPRSLVWLSLVPVDVSGSRFRTISLGGFVDKNCVGTPGAAFPRFGERLGIFA